mgnify:CR=1 FL=1
MKKSIVEKGIDFIIVRELIGGIYFGEHKTDDADGQPVATDIMKYSEAEIERIGRRARARAGACRGCGGRLAGLASDAARTFRPDVPPTAG